MAFTYTIINGSSSFDLTPYIKFQGLSYQRFGVDSQSAGRTIDGTMHLARVASKIRWDVEFLPVTQSVMSQILTALKPTTFTLRYTDPDTNTVKTGIFYANNASTAYCMQKNGVNWWHLGKCPIIEV